jgi:polar amino acid transport system substrate-binding protein
MRESKLLHFLILLGTFILGGTAQISSSHADASPLRWAADIEGSAPLLFQDPKNPEHILGFEKEIVDQIAKRLNRSEQFIQTAWDGLVPGLGRGTYDIIINGLEITEERSREISFSKPYYYTYQQLAVRKSEEGIESLEDLRGKKVGTLKLSLAHTMLEKFGGLEIVTYEGENQAYEDLQNGRTEAVLIDAPLAKYTAGTNPELKLVGKPFGEILYGIGIRKTDKALLKAVNEAIDDLISTGDLRRIYDRYDLWSPVLAKAFQDDRSALEPPTMYQYFLNATQPNRHRTFSERIELYQSFLPMLAKGALTTLEISLVAMVLAVIFGLLLALMRLYGPSPLQWFSIIYVEAIRGTPLLIQLYFIFYALPHVGVKLSPFIAAVIGLGLNYAAYEAENYRAGISGVPLSQSEAGAALGMSRGETIRHIVLPQAIRIVIPPITNDFISLLKDSSLVSVITMVELTKLYGQLSSTYYDFVGTGILVAAIYLLLGLPFVRLARYVEKRLSPQGKVFQNPERRTFGRIWAQKTFSFFG